MSRRLLDTIERELHAMERQGYGYARILLGEYRELTRLYYGKVPLENFRDRYFGNKRERWRLWEELKNNSTAEIRRQLRVLCVRRYNASLEKPILSREQLLIKPTDKRHKLSKSA